MNNTYDPCNMSIYKCIQTYTLFCTERRSDQSLRDWVTQITSRVNPPNVHPTDTIFGPIECNTNSKLTLHILHLIYNHLHWFNNKREHHFIALHYEPLSQSVIPPMRAPSLLWAFSCCSPFLIQFDFLFKSCHFFLVLVMISGTTTYIRVS